MKKLMIAAAIVCAATLSQAATVNWATDFLVGSDGEYIYEKGGEWTYTAAVVFAPSGTTTCDGDMGQWTGTGTDFSLATDYTATLTITEYKNGVATATLTAAGAFTTMADTSFDTDLDFSGGTGFTSGSFFSDGAGQWQSVPEPTSGLLLLLGVAGLALRRRRA